MNQLDKKIRKTAKKERKRELREKNKYERKKGINQLIMDNTWLNWNCKFCGRLNDYKDIVCKYCGVDSFRLDDK